MADQAETLLSLVQGEDGKDWASRRVGWSASSTEPVCMWDDIICDSKDKSTVISIRIQSADLLATIPPELGRLSNLQTLVLRSNVIHGTIPTEVGNLPHLETFDIAENRIGGTVPYFASPSLTVFDASRNVLTGSLPNNVGLAHKSMAYYDVMHNQLTGTIPKSFHEMRDLSTLSLSANSFFGLLPPALGNIVGLQYLYLDNNNLVGPIPSNIARPQVAGGTKSLLSEIWLHENALSGSVPVALADLDKLVNLYIDGNKFTGKIPEDLCSPTLNADFFANVAEEGEERNYCDSVACPVNTVAFEGVFPCTPCDLTHYNPYLGREGECIALNQRIILDKFYESTTKAGPWKGGSDWNDPSRNICDFTGVTCDTNNNVVAIELRDMDLRGTIPEELGYLEYLEYLDLADNDLTGFLPSDLRWAPLRRLDISGNRIRSIVPPMLCLKSGINGNGNSGDYNCERVACPAGTFSPIGRQSDDGELCIPCMDEESLVLGSKHCKNLGIARSETAGGEEGGMGVSGVVGVAVASAALAIAAAFFVALWVHRRKYGRRDAIPQEDVEMNDSGVYNRSGVSSLPYSDDPPLQKKKKMPSIHGSSYRDDDGELSRLRAFASDPLHIGKLADPPGETASFVSRNSSEGGRGSPISNDCKPSPDLLDLEVTRQKNEGTSTTVWDYPDPLENTENDDDDNSEWTASKESQKEVWLDVPKIE